MLIIEKIEKNKSNNNLIFDIVIRTGTMMIAKSKKK